MKMENAARMVIFAGICLLIVGTLMYLLSKFNLPLGNLPGDINIHGKNGSFHFPVVTSILVSIVLTIIINVINRFLSK